MTELDDNLRRLFAEAEETLPAAAFLEMAAGRVRQMRRRRAISRTALATAGVGAAIAVTPYVVEGSLLAASHAGMWAPGLGNALTSPIGWACSLAVAAWGLRRARR
jgi:hypothetical protein